MLMSARASNRVTSKTMPGRSEPCTDTDQRLVGRWRGATSWMGCTEMVRPKWSVAAASADRNPSAVTRSGAPTTSIMAA